MRELSFQVELEWAASGRDAAALFGVLSRGGLPATSVSIDARGTVSGYLANLIWRIAAINAWNRSRDTTDGRRLQALNKPTRSRSLEG